MIQMIYLCCSLKILEVFIAETHDLIYLPSLNDIRIVYRRNIFIDLFVIPYDIRSVYRENTSLYLFASLFFI